MPMSFYAYNAKRGHVMKNKIVKHTKNLTSYTPSGILNLHL